MSGIAILVERSSRLVLLAELDEIRAVIVASVLGRQIQTLSPQLRPSLTWDQGKEMALQNRFTVDTGV